MITWLRSRCEEISRAASLPSKLSLWYRRILTSWEELPGITVRRMLRSRKILDEDDVIILTGLQLCDGRSVMRQQITGWGETRLWAILTFSTVWVWSVMLRCGQVTAACLYIWHLSRPEVSWSDSRWLWCQGWALDIGSWFRLRSQSERMWWCLGGWGHWHRSPVGGTLPTLLCDVMLQRDRGS